MKKVNELCLALYLISWCREIHSHKANIPLKTNIAIVVDVGNKYHNYTFLLLQNILDGISLRNFRISFFTTTGYSVGILKFQSRQCTLDGMKKYTRRKETLNEVLKTVYLDSLKPFQSKKWKLVIVTDKEINNVDKGKLNHVKTYIINVKRLSRLTNHNLHGKASRKTYTIAKILPFINPHLLFCKEKTFVYDECRRLCECKDGKIVDCYRVRREFSDMDYASRIRYIKTYKEAATNRWYKAAYMKWIKIHPKYFQKGIHERGQFFPWHRKYLLGFENMLRLIDCRVTITYWNWAYYSDIAWSISPSYHMWKDDGGFGGNGKASLGFCVESGEFGYRQWKMNDNSYWRKEVMSQTCGRRNCCKEDDDECDEENSENENNELTVSDKEEYKCTMRSTKTHLDCLKRRFSSSTPKYRNVYHVIKNYNASQFSQFEDQARDSWHNAVHNHIGGHMEIDFSSESPDFWLHHGALDAFWYKWQKRGKDFEQYRGYGNMTSLSGFFPKEDLRLYIEYRNLSGCGVKVMYYNVLPSHPNDVRHILHKNDYVEIIRRSDNCRESFGRGRRKKNYFTFQGN